MRPLLLLATLALLAGCGQTPTTTVQPAPAAPVADACYCGGGGQ